MGIPTLESNIFIEIFSCFECSPGLNMFPDFHSQPEQERCKTKQPGAFCALLNLLSPKAVRQEKFELF